CGSGGDGQSFG
ncbi:unnamed protein product, partial [Rotaria magnacalcarata]